MPSQSHQPPNKTLIQFFSTQLVRCCSDRVVSVLQFPVAGMLSSTRAVWGRRLTSELAAGPKIEVSLSPSLDFCFFSQRLAWNFNAKQQSPAGLMLRDTEWLRVQSERQWGADHPRPPGLETS